MGVLALLLVFLPFPLSSTQFTAGDVAPYGSPDGQLNAGDLLILQRFLLGDLVPSTEEQLLCDVAPLGGPDGLLNAGDLALLQRAVLGLVSLPPVDIGPDTPVITTPSGSTGSNPFTVDGTAPQNLQVRLYVNGAHYSTISSGATGSFNFQAALYDGSNTIYATTWDGQFESQPSQAITIDYTNGLNRNIGGSGRISSDTVWTPGVPPQPYTVAKILTIQPGVTLTVMPGAEIQFRPDTGLDVEGQLVVRGDPGSPVLLKGDASVTPANRWNGIQTLTGATGITIDYAEIELARYGVLATDGVISITNSFFRDIDNPVTPPVDVDVIGLSRNVMSAVIADNQLLGTITNNDRLAGIHVRDINVSISGNRIDGFDNAIRVGAGANPTIGPANTITNNVNGIRIEPLAGSNADPHPTIFNNSIHSNSFNLHAGAGFDDPAWWVDAQANWWGSADPVDIAESIYDYSDVDSFYTDNIPSVDFTRFHDAPGGNETTGNYLFGRITSDKTLVAGSDYVVLGKLAIAPNVTLTIDEAVDLQFVPEASLLAYGNLSAVGNLGNLVRFSGVDWNPGLGWGGIRAMAPDLDVLLDYVEIERASADGLYFSRGDISNSYIHDNGTGIRVYWESGPSLYGESITIRDNVIRDNATNGVSVNGVQGCDNCGPGPYIQENVITGSQHGIDIRYAGSQIKGNIISSNDVGIHAFSFALNNFIYITHTGGGTNIGKGNEISGNNTGIKFTGGPNSGFTWVAPSVSGHNDIFNNALYNIELAYTGYTTFSGAYVNAHDNWWGVASSAEIAATIRDAFDVGNSQPVVDYVPYKSTGPGLGVPVIDYEPLPVATQSYTISGFAPPDVTVQIMVNDIPQLSTVADAGGIFSVAIQLAAGRNEIYSLASDGVNTSNPSESIYLDYFPTTFPPAPVLNPAVATTNDNPFRISGLANPDAVIDIYVNGLWQAATMADGNGLFSYPARLRDGQNSLFVTEDPSGNQFISANTLSVDYVNTMPRDVGGITQPTVWTVGNGDPYIVGPFGTQGTIFPDATLYIEEGVVVQFSTNAGLTVEGELLVNGTETSPVTFTSLNGTQSYDQWKQIEVVSGGQASIDHADIEYSSKGVWFHGGAGSVTNSLIRKNRSGITTQDDGGPITIQSSVIKENETGIAVGRSSNPQITDQNTIINNIQYGIGVTGTAVAGEDPAPIISGSNIHGNTLYDYRVTQFADPAMMLEAGNNWWNTPDPVVVAGRIYDQADSPSDSPTVNVTPLQPVSVDTQRPLAPIITGCTSPTDQPDCLITGLAEPGRDIQLYVNGLPAGTTMADSVTGAFSLTAILILPGANLIQTTARNGALESALSNTLVIVRDSAPPLITLTQPDTSGVANYAVIAGHLDEPAIVTVAGENATVFTDNSFAHALAGLVDGQHTVQIIATDSFGHTATTSMSFTLDTQPPAIPDTSKITVGTPTSGQVLVSAASGSATAGDTITLLNSRTGLIVQGTVEGDGSYSIQIDAETGDELVITITDTAGNTTASRILTIAGTPPALGVSITTPSAGSTVDDDTTGVTGTFQGSANVGIEVNGYTANKVGDAFCVGDIPLQAGSNILTVTARTPDGTSSSQQVTVNSTGSGPLQLEVDRTSGTAPLTVTFSLTDNTGLNLNIVDYDVDGDGATDYSSADPNATVTHTYTTPGCYTAMVTAQDTGVPGSVSSSRIIAIQNVQETMVGPLAVYYRLLDDMRTQNEAAIASAFTEGSQSKYQSLFTTLYADLPVVADSLGTVTGVEISNDFAEITVMRVKNSQPYLYYVYLVRNEYGYWEIDSM